MVSFNHAMLVKSLTGPTADIEDNIQLHSAAEADCEIFLTHDKDLLSMAFFGKMKIVESV